MHSTLDLGDSTLGLGDSTIGLAIGISKFDILFGQPTSLIETAEN